MAKKSLFKYVDTNVLPSPLSIKLPQISGYVQYFHSNNKYMSFSVHDIELSKNTIQYGIILVIYLNKKRGFAVNQYIKMNTLKLKYICIMVK